MEDFISALPEMCFLDVHVPQAAEESTAQSMRLHHLPGANYLSGKAAAALRSAPPPVQRHVLEQALIRLPAV